MKDIQYLVSQLARNKNTFQELLEDRTAEEYQWKKQKENWCLLEIVCHLYDEETHDFRARIQHIFSSPDTAPPAFNPVAWVTDHHYMGQDYEQKIHEFLKRREHSIEWIQGQLTSNWSEVCELPGYSQRSARFYLANWVAHDLLHIKQITRVNYDFLAESTNISLAYAGEWT